MLFPLLLGATLMASADPPGVVSPANAEHYRWGDCCDGWYLVKNERLNIIEELLPAGAGETLHLHRKAQQFFYVVAGQATIHLGEKSLKVKRGKGVRVPPGVAHRVHNAGTEALRIVVTSEPPSHGDREEVGAK